MILERWHTGISPSFWVILTIKFCLYCFHLLEISFLHLKGDTEETAKYGHILSYYQASWTARIILIGHWPLQIKKGFKQGHTLMMYTNTLHTLDLFCTYHHSSDSSLSHFPKQIHFTTFERIRKPPKLTKQYFSPREYLACWFKYLCWVNLSWTGNVGEWFSFCCSWLTSWGYSIYEVQSFSISWVSA